MKNSFKTYFILLTSVLFLSNCKKERQTEIILEYPLVFLDNMEIDTLNIDSLIIRETFDFPTSLEGDLAKNNTSKAKIKSAKLVYMRIQVMDYAWTDTTKYSNFRDLSMMSLDIKKDGIGQELVASKTINSNDRIKAINMDLSDVECRDYLKQDQFRMVVKYRKRRGMHHEMPFSITLRFKIVADPL